MRSSLLGFVGVLALTAGVHAQPCPPAPFIAVGDDQARLYVVPWDNDANGFAGLRNLGNPRSGISRGLTIGDIDNDGDLDIAHMVGSGNNYYVFPYLNDGCNNFTVQPSLPVQPNTSSYAMDGTGGDFNNDGLFDFIGNVNNNRTHFYQGGGQSGPTFIRTERYSSTGRGMDAADFDDDGNLDFVRAEYSSGRLYFHKGVGDGTFAPQVLITDVGSDPYGVTAGDFDEDGFVDVITNDGGGGNIRFLRGNGDGTFQAATNIPNLDQNNHGAFDAYDFDGDGHLDIAAVNYTGRRVRWARGLGGGAFDPFVDLGNLSTNSLGVAAPFHQRGPNRVAAVIAGDTEGEKNVAASFDGSGSANAVSSVWDFDDGTPPVNGGAPGPIQHTFAGAGLYMVSLTVTDADGRVARTFHRIAVTGAGPTFGVAICDPGDPPECGQELCNGQDDDCDGVADENTVDSQGTCTASTGACSVTGPLACENGQVVCTVEPPVAGAELCNGEDDDCDGANDEDFAGLGDACTAGAGICARDGVTVCNAGLNGTTCSVQAGQAQAETCNGLDDDCDGLTDEGFGAGVACASGVGACEQPGQTVCNLAGDGVVCDAIAGNPQPEACDQLDNDCDGSSDEDFPTLPCGQGACFRQLGQCGANPPACDPFEGAQAETCNGIDDDCDGTVDENTAEANLDCTEGLGACADTGTTSCVAGAVVCSANPGQPAAEVCDQIDNDCNGVVDDGDTCPDTSAPEVTVAVFPEWIDPGQLFSITVNATDDRQLDTLDVTFDGQPVNLVDGVAFLNAPAQPGIYGVSVVATDSSGNQTVETARLVVFDNADQTLPEIEITAPENDDEVAAPVDVVGTASDANLVEYRLEFAEKQANNPQWTTFHVGDASVVDGVLGQLDPTLMRNGMYRIRLSAQDLSGRTVRREVTVRVHGQAKVGVFTYTFNDMNLPVAGIPVQVNRTYDSRIKTREDFGVGWYLDMKDGKLEHSSPLHRGWNIAPGGLLGLPCQQTLETEPHTTELQIGDGERYVFRPELTNPAIIGGGCQVFFRYVHVYSSTRIGARLEVLGGGGPLIWLAAEDRLITLDVEDFDVDRVRLVLDDGRRIYFSRNAEGVYQIDDRNGNSVRITANGLVSNSGRDLGFQRDGQGRITAITAPDGTSVTYTYDANGDLVAVTNEVGEVTRFTYDARHNLQEIIDPSGNIPSRQEYDETGRMIAVVYPDGTRVNMDHDLGNRIELVRDRVGSTEVLEYDARGNVIRKVDKLGRTWLFTYDGGDRKLTETDPSGNVSTYTYDSVGRILTMTDPLGNRLTNTWNAQGKIATRRDPNGNVTTYTYDADGNRATRVEADGGVWRWTYDDNGMLLTETDPTGAVTRTEHDEFGQLIREVSPTGIETTYTYSPVGKKLTESVAWTAPNGQQVLATTRYTYDNRQRLLTRTMADGGVYTWTYDPVGRKTSERDPLGRVTSFTYDVNDRLIRTTHPDGTTDLTAYDGEGRITRKTDRAGRVQISRYDAAGQLVQREDATGATVTMTYDADGLVLTRTDERGGVTTQTYDAGERMTSMTDAVGETTTYTYDAKGNRASMTGPDNQTTTYTYDAKNRLVSTTYPGGTTRSKTYDTMGRVLTETDENGNTSTFAYDGEGRLTQVTDAAGGVTAYSYDEMHRKTRITDALNRVTRMDHDIMGRPIAKVLPSGRSMGNAYDLVGNMTQRTTYAGQAITFEYDSMNRLTRRTLPEGVETGTWTATDKRATVNTAWGQSLYAYDALDRMTSKTEPDGTTVQWQRDAGGLVTRVTSPHGATNYAYDAAGRLTTITDAQGGVTTYTYHPTGERATQTLPNGLVTTYTYDVRRRLVGLETRDAGNNVVSSYAYTLGDAGERLRVVEASGRQIDYAYDALYRLTSEVTTEAGGAVSTTTYTYDAVGNRLTKTVDGAVSTSTYNADDQLTDLDGTAYAYDLNGNLTQIGAGAGAVQQTFDSINRLASATAGGSTVNYTYDIDDIRVASEFDDGGGGPPDRRRYVAEDQRTGLAQTLYETDGDDNPVVDYLVGLETLGQKRGNADQYYVTDGQLSVREITDAAGAVTDTYRYDAFGNETRRTGNSENDVRFGGQFLDPNTGFYYLRARWYDQSVGRFMSVDPMEGLEREPQTLHRYTYTVNDPINAQDPSGKFFVSMTISFGIQGGLRSTYISHMLRFMMKAIKIAQCQLKPAMDRRFVAMEEIVAGAPWADEHYRLAQQEVVSAFRAFGMAALEMAKAMVNSAMPTFEEAKDDSYAAYLDAVTTCANLPYCHTSQSVQAVQHYKQKVDDSSAKAEKMWDTAVKVYELNWGAETACEKATFAADAVDILLDWMPKF